MKYPCEDGIDRDKDIETYLTTEALLQTARLQRNALDDRIQEYEEELENIQHEELGSIGDTALQEARKTFRPAAPTPRYRAEGNQVIEMSPISGNHILATTQNDGLSAELLAKRIAEALNEKEKTLATIAIGAGIMGGFPQ